MPAKFLRGNNLPTCSDGSPSMMSCRNNLACSPGFECSNGGCCPIPFCPSGIQSIGHCHANNRCRAGTACLDGLCCPLPVCPQTGQIALAACSTNTLYSCGLGYECYKGGCCQLPMCPGGELAYESCSESIPQCSCADSICKGGVCCTLPSCFDAFSTERISSSLFSRNNSPNSIAISFCTNALPYQDDEPDFGDIDTVAAAPPLLAAVCPPGFQCASSGGCCPLPVCASSGQRAAQACEYIGDTPVCPTETICEVGFCCPLPKCSLNGQLPMSICGSGNSCPEGYFCDGNGCCPEPLPVCPNGGRAIQACVRGNECPAGYGCTPMGGCCQLSAAHRSSSCPPNLIPLCYCSHNAVCPSGSFCHAGSCCTSLSPSMPVKELNIPGTRCERTVECRGSSQGLALCMEGLCVCTNGAYSNGVACVAANEALLQRARNGCDQFGSSCKYILSPARRAPLLTPFTSYSVGSENELGDGIIADETDSPQNATINSPIWFNVAVNRRCLFTNGDLDNTCLPNEKCIQGKCKRRLLPGEYGCSTNEECSSKCLNTYCNLRGESQSQCLCTDGYLLYNRCFRKCPDEFHIEEDYCEHDDEEEFWKNMQAQAKLQKLLNENIC